MSRDYDSKYCFHRRESLVGIDVLSCEYFKIDECSLDENKICEPRVELEQELERDIGWVVDSVKEHNDEFNREQLIKHMRLNPDYSVNYRCAGEAIAEAEKRGLIEKEQDSQTGDVARANFGFNMEGTYSLVEDQKKDLKKK